MSAVRCSRCGRSFRHERDLQNHIRDHHLRGGRKPDRVAHAVPVEPRDEPESMAEIAVEARLKRAMGVRLDPLEESLLG